MHMIRSHSSAGIGAVAIVTMLCPIRGGALATPDTTEVYEYVLSWGEQGTGPGQFNGASKMGSDLDGNIYVCDDLNYRIQKFDSLGNFLMMFGEYGQGPGQFRAPTDVAVDDSGYIYVTDFYSCRVQKFDRLGQFVLEFGEYGHEPGQFGWPQNLAVGDSDYVYVVDVDNHWVQRFTGGGEFDTLLLPPDSMPYHERVVTTYPGSVFAVWARTGPTEKRIYRSDPVGNTIVSFGGFGSEPGEFIFVGDMAADPEGSLFITDDWLTRVTKYDSLGNFVTMWGSHGSGPGQFGVVVGVATDLYGNVYVSDYDYDRIQKFRRTFVKVEDGADEELEAERALWLGPNVPNPFAGSTSIAYAVPGIERSKGLRVRLMVYNLLGQALITLVDAEQPPGPYTVNWDGCSASGHPVASGVYLYRLECGGEVVTRRCVLVR
jgi:DNA-binding beta-propeller fold protein YncE